MYKMKNVCDELNLPYETLRYYCNEGLVPNIKRDDNNHRIFDDKDVDWLKGLQCLRACGLSINDIKDYLNLCLEGPSSIMKRKEILSVRREILVEEMSRISESIAYIDNKQTFYDDVLSGKTKYSSNLIKR